MANCGCKGLTCGCKVVAGRNARVSGNGDTQRPYRIDALPVSLSVQNSSTVDLDLTGTGTAADPWIVTAEVSPSAFDGKWSMWSGTQAEYDALGSVNEQTLYVILEGA